MPFVVPQISDDELNNLQPISYRDRQRQGPPNAITDDFGNKIDPNAKISGPGFSITAREYYAMDATQRQALKNKGLEDLAGQVPLIPGLQQMPGIGPVFQQFGIKSPTAKPLAQFFNAVGSEGFTEGLVTGPLNAVSNLGNAVGDVVLGKDVDTSDAWAVTDEQAARINPGRYSINQNDPFQRDTPADVAGRPLGRVAGAEVLGTITGAGIARRLTQIPLLARAGNALMQTRRVREYAFLARRSPDAARNLNLARGAAETLGSTTTAALYMDPLKEGNLLNAADDIVIDPSNRDGIPFVRAVRDDETGLRLSGRVDAENQNYLEALRDQVLVDGLLAPLTVVAGIGSVGPLRNALVGTNLPKSLNDVAETALAPYAPSRQALLPPAPARDVVPDGTRTLPGVVSYGDDPANWPTMGDQSWRQRQTVPEDSAISRAQSSNLQVQQVEAQRRRLEDMGLEVRTADGQYELTFPDSVSPEVAQQIRALQRERYELIKANSGVEVTPEVAKQSDQIEAQIQALQSGGGQELIPGLEVPVIEPRQYADAPDPRPELSTFLAELDELSDQQLRDMLPKVSRDEKLAQRQQQLNATQQQVADLEQQLIEIQSRMALPEGSKKRLTATGAKRLTNKIQKQLDAARVEMQRLEVDPAAPVLVGDQLSMDLSTPPTMRQLDALAEEAAPNTFDQIDQLVADGKAALVDMEFDERLGVFRPVGAEISQGYSNVAAYKDELMGWPRDLLRRMNAPNEVSGSADIAAILKARTGRRVWSAKKEDIVDAMVEFAQRQGKFAPRLEQLDLELQQTLNLNVDPQFPGGRGLSGEAREDLKRQILQAAIDNGEVQPDVTPIPARIPSADYSQGELIDSLMADESGQMALAFANDAMPVYDIPTPKSLELKLEEMRTRYDWAVLDNEARKAANAAYLEEQGWNNLTWEEKKRMGLLGTQFSMPGDQNARSYTGVLRAETPGYSKFADLSEQVLTPDAPAPKGRVLRWSAFGNLKEELAKRRDQLRATRKPKKTSVTAENRAAARNQRQLDATEKDLQARLDQLKKQAEEATCNG